MSSANDSSHLSRKRRGQGLFYGALSVFIGVLAASLTFPFQQSQRDLLMCDALCYGSMQSARSFLSLLGSALVGRLSDKYGRQSMLWVGLLSSIVSYIIYLNGTSIMMLWIAMIPSSLLNQNYSVLKALFADYNTDSNATESERAAGLGRLGMAVGLSFMVGPVLGAIALKTYQQSIRAALVLSVLSGVVLLFLPTPEAEIIRRNSSANLQELQQRLEKEASNKQKDKEKPKTSYLKSTINPLLELFHLPVAQTPGARLLFFMRLSMGISFHVFMTVWPSSLKSRFSFGPTDHAYFMGWIGFCYAVSQGFIAHIMIKLAGDDPTVVLIVCMAALGTGRVLAITSSSLVLVYLITAVVIVALGIVNTAISSACTTLAGADQVGGLFGVLEAVESLAGLIGPTLGGLLFALDDRLPIIVVVAVYMSVLGAVMLLYRPTIIEKHSTVELPSSDSHIKNE
eukprot:gene16990-22487_t